MAKTSAGIGSWLSFIFAVCTAMVGYHIHGSLGWAIINALFSPLAWAKWLICHEVTLKIIAETFSFFLA
jgi:hypothetical protein